MRDEFLESMYLNKLKSVFNYKIEVFVFKYTNTPNTIGHDLSVSLDVGYNSYVVYENITNVSGSDSINSLVRELNSDIRLIKSNETSFKFLSDQFKSKQIHLNGPQKFFY